MTAGLCHSMSLRRHHQSAPSVVTAPRTHAVSTVIRIDFCSIVSMTCNWFHIFAFMLRTLLIATVNRCPHYSTPPLLTGSVRRVVHEEHGCNKWKKTLACMLALPRSRAKIVRCGGRYDPQLVKRSSEWVSESRTQLIHSNIHISTYRTLYWCRSIEHILYSIH